MCRIVKSIFAFPEWDMLVVATSSSGMINLGKLRVMHLPTSADLQHAESKRKQAPESDRHAQPTVDLQIYVHEAHKRKILATARMVCANCNARFTSSRAAVLSIHVSCIRRMCDHQHLNWMV